MTKAVAVIGANYGDEGKGVTVHHLAKTLKPTLVVRFNGGPQAGHTVHNHTNKGTSQKYIFSTYGSGTFQKIPTYLTSRTLFNPREAKIEYEELTKLLGHNIPKLKVNGNSPIITPWDIALNQFKEKGRGPNNYGSCGKGIGEAVRRILSKEGPKLYAKDIANPSSSFLFGVEIRKWFASRVKEESEKGNFTYLTEEQKNTLYSVLQYPTALMLDLYQYVTIISKIILVEGKPYKDEDILLYEGAQGLLLDEDDPDHQPHVTWSKTGLQNVVEDCKANSVELTDVYYVTRPYLTRHGNGPVKAGIEMKGGDIYWGRDVTNKENEYQGKFRYAHLDWEKLQLRIKKDIEAQGFLTTPKVHLVVTCGDQVENLDEEKYRLIIGQDIDELIPSAEFETAITKILDSNVISQVHFINGLKG